VYLHWQPRKGSLRKSITFEATAAHYDEARNTTRPGLPILTFDVDLGTGPLTRPCFSAVLGSNR
jgi:hypothetical protein